MTAKTAASIGSEILEERILSCVRGTTGLKGRDTSAGIRINFKLRYASWRRLGALINVTTRKAVAHFLRVADCARRPIYILGRVDNVLFLRQGGLQQAAQKVDESET
jgi:hypothetical protein